MVGALVEVGVIDDLATTMTEAVGDNYLAAGTVLIWASGLLSGVVDNIPYVATASPPSQLPTSRRESAGLRPGGGRWRLRPGAVAVVGPRARRRPRRERHRRRGERQRRRPRLGRAQRPPDLVLAVHPLRARRGDGDHRGRLGATTRCATSPLPDPHGRGDCRIPRTRSILGAMDLASIEEIKRLKHRYFRSLDLKEWETFGDCLAEDVRARYGTQAMDKPLHYDNREDVVEFMSTNLGTGIITMHVAQHPEIDVDGDTATGSWGFEDTVIVPGLQGPHPRCRLLPRQLPSRPRRCLADRVDGVRAHLRGDDLARRHPQLQADREPLGPRAASLTRSPRPAYVAEPLARTRRMVA